MVLRNPPHRQAAKRYPDRNSQRSIFGPKAYLPDSRQRSCPRPPPLKEPRTKRLCIRRDISSGRVSTEPVEPVGTALAICQLTLATPSPYLCPHFYNRSNSHVLSKRHSQNHPHRCHQRPQTHRLGVLHIARTHHPPELRR
jgi:hypothetical protein